MENLFGKTPDELKIVTEKLGLPAYAAGQLAGWLYRGRAASFDEMTNLSLTARRHLAESYSLKLSPPSSAALSCDGTKKYLFQYGDSPVETVWIPDERRGTLCVSSQAGCRRGCRFCMTARQGLQAGLSAEQILNQFRSVPESEQITHLVFMGMGEPLDNMDAVLTALNILTSDRGYGISPKKITVSTIGTNRLPAFLKLSDCRLAYSLHSPFADERARLIPSESQYPARQALVDLRSAERRRVTVEYLMIDGLNDTQRHNDALARLLKGTDFRVNLIPFHPVPGFPGAPSPSVRMNQFQKELMRRGLTVTVRRSRGLDIGAACGLLKSG